MVVRKSVYTTRCRVNSHYARSHIRKSTLRAAGVEVAPYTEVYNEADLIDGIETIGLPAVLKTARGGYDGKGQFVLRDHEQMKEALPLLDHGPCVLESWIPFEKEISVVMTRNTNGEVSYFPVGENIHVNNILYETIVPARVSSEVEKRAAELAMKIANELNLVGTLAIEMFLTKDEKLYVNELAPRPHNSGHYTIEACNISQFGQHIRAICGWPLMDVKLLSPAIMVNVLGQHMQGVINGINKNPHWFVHFYEKKEVKQDRKMGHITILTKEIEQTLQQIEEQSIWK